MAIFGRKKEEEYKDEEYEVEASSRKIRDLKPENRRKRKEPPKPWGKKERYIVLFTLLLTVLIAASLSVSARDFKLPGLPRFSFSKWEFNFFKPETITIGRRSDPEKQKSENVIKSFDEKVKPLSGNYALYIIDLTGGYSFGIREETVMQAASLIKLPVMLYADGRVDDSKLEAMGKRSDNAVFTEMRKKFGDTALQDYMNSLGMINTSLVENQTTPKEIGELFKKIYEDKNEKVLGYLTDTTFEEWITPGVPAGARVAHKYGREVHVVNDAGIVYAASPYVVVIMSQGVVEKEADSVFPELSRLVYDGMK